MMTTNEIEQLQIQIQDVLGKYKANKGTTAYNEQLNSFELRNSCFGEFPVDLFGLNCNLRFVECSFNNFKYPNEANNKLTFENCTFNKEVLLKTEEYLSVFQMIGCTFKDKVIIETHFRENAYFDNSIFCKDIDLMNAEVDKILSLQGVQLEGFIKVSSSLFERIDFVKLANTECDFEFKDINKLEEKSVDNYRIYKDSYRSIKCLLIKQQNFIYAQFHKKYELYFYEKEVKQILDNQKSYSKDKKLSLSKRMQYYVEYIQLLFYRHTSDHHTNLLKVWHSLLVVIGIFGLLSGVIIVGFDYLCLDFFDWNVHSLIKVYDVHIKHFTLTHIFWVLRLNFLLLIAFIALFLSSIFSNIARMILICLSYCVAIGILISSPKYLIPAMGIFTDKRAMFDPISAIGGVYTILFGLMLYSLIKTARKNSIMPS